jgi:transposase
MSENTIKDLIKTRERVVRAVMSKELSTNTAASLLGITRQGLWKIVKRVKKEGLTQSALLGRKRGPKGGRINPAWNRTPEWLEEKLED